MREFNEIEESKLEVQYIDGETMQTYIDQDGKKKKRKVLKVHWEVADKPVSLGSMANPNKKIHSVRFNVPKEDENPLVKLIRGLGK